MMIASPWEHVLLQRIGSIQFSNSQVWGNCIVEPLVADPLIPIASQVGSGNYLIHPQTRCEITKLTLVEIICVILRVLCFWLPSFWASVLLSQSANQGRFVACDQEPRSVVPSDRPGEGKRCGSQNCISVIFQSCFILHSFQHRRTQETST